MWLGRDVRVQAGEAVTDPTRIILPIQHGATDELRKADRRIRELKGQLADVKKALRQGQRRSDRAALPRALRTSGARVRLRDAPRQRQALG